MPLEPTPLPPAPSTPNPPFSPGWLRDGGWRAVGLGVAGAVVGGTYAQLVGCRTGGCAILSNLGSATLAGGLIGLVFGWPAPPKRG